MRLGLFAGLTAITLWVLTLGMAAGSDIHDPIVEKEASGTAGPPYLGCGTHRHYDPKMRKCLGPGDF